MLGMIVGIIVVLLLIVLCIRCICIVPQASAWIVEALGQYKATWGAGLHFKVPIIHRVIKKVSLKEQVADFEPQPVITKDNVTMMVDSVVFFYIFDAKLFAYGVDRVEAKNIAPPRSIQEAMEKQMKAEREKREAILTAEGKKQSAITLAEGEKEAAILRAEAVKQQRIREAEGEAEALLAVQKARAEGIRMINEAAPSAGYLTMESYKAAEKMADGQATKIIVPSDISNLAGTLSALSAVVKDPQEPKGE